ARRKETFRGCGRSEKSSRYFVVSGQEKRSRNMSVQFRQRTPGEYLKILKRRKWLIILPVIAVASAVAWVVYRLPDVYESSTLIVVKPATLPNSVVPTVTDDSLTRQLSSIAQ